MVREVSTCRGVHVRSVPEVRKLVMTDGVLLQPEQEELLKALVEASRNVPRDEREEFHLLTDGDGTSVMHPALPGRQMRVHQVEETLTRYLDSDAFQRSYPEAHRKWADAAERLSRSDSQQQWTMIGHLCREAMQAFATELVEQHKPPAVTPDKAKDVARIRAVLDQRKSMLRTTVAPFLDALLAYRSTGARRKGPPLFGRTAGESSSRPPSSCSRSTGPSASTRHRGDLRDASTLGPAGRVP